MKLLITELSTPCVLSNIWLVYIYTIEDFQNVLFFFAIAEI